MPELPEVEIVRRNLARWTVGRTVRALDAPDPRALAGDASDLVGQRFTAWERRGKLLVGHVAGPGPAAGVLSHLGMTGKWVRASHGRRFVRLALTLDDGVVVGLVDPRRLGWTRLVAADPSAAPELHALPGPQASHPAENHGGCIRKIS